MVWAMAVLCYMGGGGDFCLPCNILNNLNFSRCLLIRKNTKYQHYFNILTAVNFDNWKHKYEVMIQVWYAGMAFTRDWRVTFVRYSMCVCVYCICIVFVRSMFWLDCGCEFIRLLACWLANHKAFVLGFVCLCADVRSWVDTLWHHCVGCLFYWSDLYIDKEHFLTPHLLSIH